jgi:hypothetical protein
MIGIAISRAAFHFPLRRIPRAAMSEMEAAAITRYGALSFPEN